MRQKLLIFLTVLLVSGCSGKSFFEPPQTATSSPSPSPTITPTNTPAQTRTPTPTNSSVVIPPFLPVGSIKQIFQDTDSCEIPCWQDIRPSVTTENELYEKIDSLKLVVSQNDPNDEFTWVQFEENEYNLMWIILKNNIVDTIMFYGVQNQTVEYVNSVLGNPQGLTCIYSVPGMYFTSLFYPNSGIEIDVMVNSSKDNLYSVKKNSQVVFIEFVQPYKPSEYLAEFQKAPNNVVIRNAKELYIDWKGYDDYPYCECEDENLCKDPSK
jgi:hypothetical protein